ncbi:stage V sporulation protein AE [Alkaliphilus metalliredigens QYMF]|uniref:Stage V sporulation protein AE n=1 Tax=Alkaliphilus metalliredigens (strain QYMF) TaxID=293826 RepID=A6TQB2_ALKMQ|nr:stage V sporulation protein AE [Alkaliphilus metalliredigens]ABR48380.1 stage V sporulation protein AE [Alkaliphilus metalliredigens QYMF]
MKEEVKRKVIFVTDGDRCAQRTVEVAVKNVGGRCISSSGGNPTPLSSPEIIKRIKEAKHDPVVVMVDDKGNSGTGVGEQALYEMVNHPDIEVMGIIAVASNTKGVQGAHVDFSVDQNGKIIESPVDKDGHKSIKKVLYGDTVDILDQCHVPIIVGIGDIGKMEGHDSSVIGAPIITKALREVMNRSKDH